MWFNKKSGRMPEDRGWEAMRQMLDKELPENNRKNRLILWSWPLLFGLGLGYYFTYQGDTNIPAPEALKSAEAKPGATVNLPTKVEDYSLKANEVHTDKKIPASSSIQRATKLKTSTASRAFRKNNQTTNQGYQQTRHTNHPSHLSEAAINENALIASNQLSANPMDEETHKKEQNSGINVEDSRNTWITAFLEEKELQAPIDNSDYPFPNIALIKHKARKSSIIMPFVAVAGLMSHDTKDKGYSFGVGLQWKPLSRFSLSAGANYENFRGIYSYPDKSEFTSLKSNDFTDITNVRQWSLPILLHMEVIPNSISLQGGLVSNYIRKTNEYYALPALADVELSPGSVENSLTFASAAAHSIPRHYFEWQAGISYRFWKSFSGTVYYRRQFEKENPGIVPSTGLYGLQLIYHLK